MERERVSRWGHAVISADVLSGGGGKRVRDRVDALGRDLGLGADEFGVDGALSELLAQASRLCLRCHIGLLRVTVLCGGTNS